MLSYQISSRVSRSWYNEVVLVIVSDFYQVIVSDFYHTVIV